MKNFHIYFVPYFDAFWSKDNGMMSPWQLNHYHATGTLCNSPHMIENLWCNRFISHISGGSRISPRWGRQPYIRRQHTILPKFPKTAWNWKNLDPQGGGDVIRNWTVPKTKSLSNPVPDWMFRVQSWRIKLSVLTLFVLQRSASGFTRQATVYTRISLVKILGHGYLPWLFLKPFRIVFLHQFSLLSDTVTFHLCSVIEGRITSNVVRLTMSW